jgi:hypothetical protein
VSLSVIESIALGEEKKTLPRVSFFPECYDQSLGD